MRLASNRRSPVRGIRLAGAALLVGALLTSPAIAGCSFTLASSRKVLVIVEENHAATAVRPSTMPYLSSLAARYGYAANYRAVAHPSLPNYLAITAGSTFGVSDDLPPSAHRITATSTFVTGGRSYEQGMTANCQQTAAGRYAVKHNPQAYYANESVHCRAGDRPLTAFAGDVRQGLAAVSFVTPDLTYDAHDGTLADADAFLRFAVPAAMAGPDYRAGRLTIVVTFDEGVGPDQQVFTAVINPRLRAVRVRAPLTHYSLARWLFRVAGTAARSRAASAADMGTAFGL